MTTPAVCTHCGRQFEVPTSMVGGFANCPDCGKAAPVEGLRDPIWRLWQTLGVVGAVGVASLVYWQAGAGPAIATGAAALGLAWLISRSF